MSEKENSIREIFILFSLFSKSFSYSHWFLVILLAFLNPKPIKRIAQRHIGNYMSVKGNATLIN